MSAFGACMLRSHRVKLPLWWCLRVTHIKVKKGVSGSGNPATLCSFCSRGLDVTASSSNAKWQVESCCLTPWAETAGESRLPTFTTLLHPSTLHPPNSWAQPMSCKGCCSSELCFHFECEWLDASKQQNGLPYLFANCITYSIATFTVWQINPEQRVFCADECKQWEQWGHRKAGCTPDGWLSAQTGWWWKGQICEVDCQLHCVCNKSKWVFLGENGLHVWFQLSDSVRFYGENRCLKCFFGILGWSAACFIAR